MKNNHKMKVGINIALSVCLASSMLACTSTTHTGTVGVKRQQLMLLSRQEVEQMSAKGYRQELQKASMAGKLDTNPAQLARLKRIVNRLVAHTSIYRPDAVNWQWEVHTIKSNTMNAHVLPGGKIMVYTGIIDRLKLTDAEISAIIGHEMAHALREHNRERMSSRVATQMGIGILAGRFGLSQGQVKAASIASTLGINMPHGRVQEKEADVMGLELMARAGYNPQSAITLWQKMQRANPRKIPQILNTHPNIDQRIATMQGLIPTVMPLYQQNSSKSKAVNRKHKHGNKNKGKIDYKKFNKH